MEQLREQLGDSDFDRITRQFKNTTDRTIKNMVDIKKYLPSEYVSPPQWENDLQDFLYSNLPLMILEAPAGAGKSCVLCNVAESLQERGHIVLLLSQSEILPILDLQSHILKQIGCHPELSLASVLSALQFLHPHEHESSRHFFLLIDGLNELPGDIRDQRIQSVIELLQSLLDKTELHWKAIVSFRDIAVQQYATCLQCFAGVLFSRGDSHSNLIRTVKIRPFSKDSSLERLYSRYEQRFQLQRPYHALTKNEKTIFSTPLMLRFAAEAFIGETWDAHISSDLVFEKFFSRRTRVDLGATLDRRRQVHSALSCVSELILETGSILELDAEALEQKLSGHDIDHPNEVCGLLLDEGLMSQTERNGRIYLAFTFELFAEYVLSTRTIPELFTAKLPGEAVSILDEHYSLLKILPLALKRYLRRMMKENLDAGIDLLSRMLSFRTSIVPEAVGTLLGELIAHRNLEMADRVIQEVRNIHHAERDRIWEIVERAAFDTGDIDRLLAIGNEHLTSLYQQRRFEDCADVQNWIANVHYIRRDDYKEAKLAYEEAIDLYRRHIQSMQVEAKQYRAKYYLARVLSDSGDVEEARQLATECLQFYEARDDANPEIAFGKALANFLLYMIHGDAEGDFHVGRGYLEKASEFFDGKAHGDPRCRARISVNQSIVELCTGTFQAAKYMAEKAICECQEADDDEATAYAYLNHAAILIQMGAAANLEKRCLVEARGSLQKAYELYLVTDELYIDTMRKANLGVIELMEGNVTDARRLFQEVILEVKLSSDDFFNGFDAEVLLAGQINRDENLLKDLLSRAADANYTQGMLHTYWQLADLAGARGNIESEKLYERNALEIAERIGWGTDKSESIYMGFYAGLYI